MLHYILHEMRILQANFVQSRNMKSRMNHRRYNAQAHLRSKLLNFLETIFISSVSSIRGFCHDNMPTRAYSDQNLVIGRIPIPLTLS